MISDTEFEIRLKKHYDEIKWLCMELYPENSDCFEKFIAIMMESYDNRKMLLKQIDKEQEQHPDWYKSNNLLGMMK